MTMPSTLSRAVFHGNGAATQFPFNFRVWDASQLDIQVAEPSGAMKPAVGCTVELSPSGGVITYAPGGAPLPEGFSLVVLRRMPFTQNVNLMNGTRFDPQVVEIALDQAAAERQQLLEAVERAVKVPPGEGLDPTALVNDVRQSTVAALAAAAEAQQCRESAASDAALASEAAASARIEADLVQDLANLQPASAEKRGFIKVGDGLVVDAEGRLSVLPVELPPAVPGGMIVAFSGVFGGSDGKRPIPRGGTKADEGWALCDGTGGTPNLRGRMIMGAGAGYAPASTGGAGTHTHTVPAGTAGATTLTAAQMPSHGHSTNAVCNSGGIAYQGNGDYTFPISEGVAAIYANGSSGSHTHSTPGSTTAAAPSLPPYYALSFIMKL